MPAIWSSSERPISVRTVWVDGVRHAILSQDDPLLNVKASRRRPQSTSTIKDKNYPIKFEPYKPATPPENCSFDGCFVKVRLVVEKNNSSQGSGESSTRGIVRRQSAPVCTRLLQRTVNLYTNESLDQDTSQETSLIREAAVLAQEEKSIEMSFKLDEETKRAETPQLNTLSERVLQWLDLSGKVQDYEREETQEHFNDSLVEKPTNPVDRRKFVNFKEDRLTSLKILVPTQSVMVRQKQGDNTLLNGVICEKRFRKGKNVSRKQQKIDLQARESMFNVKLQDESERRLWTPPSKPQLHIFMPSLKANELHHWTSSQESLIYE